MREAAFHRQKADRWKQFESMLRERASVDPDKLAELYIEVTDDLAFSRTFFPESRITTYLNALAAELHGRIYRVKTERLARIQDFWRRELPLIFYKHRRELLYALLITAASAALGVVSTASDSDFVRYVLGDSYVSQTIENIRSGHPMAVYSSDGEVASFFVITLNNVRVSFLAFAAGLLLSIGSAYVLFTNGLMLGTFHYLFYERGLLATMVLTVWIHGTLEISAAVISGASGLVIGNSLLFPGTWSRGESFRRGAKEGLKMVIGVVPILIIAAFLEGFVTRHDEMPPFVSISIIALSLAFVIFYVIIYPGRLHKRTVLDEEFAAESSLR